MKLSALISAIEAFAPGKLQESWDNTGLQIGLPDGDGEVSGALVCVDVTEAVVDEAVRRGCNVVLSHHPLIFKGFRSLTGSTPQQRAALTAVRAGVAVYSTHTALDSTRDGISYAMAAALGLEVVSVLAPTHLSSILLTVCCEAQATDDVRLALFDVGADDGDITTITACAAGMTTDADGTVAMTESDKTLVRVVTDPLRIGALRRALAGMTSTEMTVTEQALDGHPAGYGLGVVARVPHGASISGSDLIDLLHSTFGTPAIRTSAAFDPAAEYSIIAMCGGSGGEFINDAFRAGAQAYISADIRYHDMADAAENGRTVFDVGHFESEQCAKTILLAIISKKFPNFAVYSSETDTNPVKYL
ncbi:MAG: Nif3-like dinuclear metal center hexameric protein [Muribaculaceae bacterium]|nr:Nif3-like dinuclear metal center hexameric protein [Muribaculaceae bacterium]